MQKLKKEIESLAAFRSYQVNVIWPYELITQPEIESLGSQAKHEIFSRCKSSLDSADMVIAVLDGPQVDDGTAWEIGYFYARRSSEQRIIGVRTDFRRAGESEGAVVNAMIEMSCDLVFRTRQELLDVISRIFAGISSGPG